MTVVILGAGLAGWRTAMELRRLGATESIIVIGRENEIPYDRPPLSKRLLSGEIDPSEIRLAGAADAADLGITLMLGRAVNSVTPASVILDQDQEIGWDTLVLATGAAPIVPAFVPQHRKVHTLRTLSDALALREACSVARSLVVVGGGFIGAEVAATARALGLDVTVVEARPHLAFDAVGPHVGSRLDELHRGHGVRVLVGDPVSRMAADDAGVRVETEAGQAISADQAVIGLGVRPNVGVMASLGIDLSGGVACDDRGRVDGVPGAYAVGDVASWTQSGGARKRREHWSSASDQAVIVAHDLLGLEPPKHALGPPYAWSDQYGIKVQMLGRAELADRHGWIEQADGTGVYGYHRGDLLVAVTSVGPPRLLAKYRATVTTAVAELSALTHQGALDGH